MPSFINHPMFSKINTLSLLFIYTLFSSYKKISLEIIPSRCSLRSDNLILSVIWPSIIKSYLISIFPSVTSTSLAISAISSGDPGSWDWHALWCIPSGTWIMTWQRVSGNPLYWAFSSRWRWVCVNWPRIRIWWGGFCYL